jgi:hypothetical protein
MKKLTLLFSLLTLCNFNVQSQTIINGSFEGSSGCHDNLPNINFNSAVMNCYTFGNGDQIDLYDNSCSYGAPQQGNSFIALTADSINNKNDALSMRLSSPLVSGSQYHLTFYYKKNNTGISGCPLEIGYSSDSLSLGTLIANVNSPNTSWNQVSLPFTPINNSNFITIRTVDGSYGGIAAGYAWDFVDNFEINQTTGLIDDASVSQIVIFPNPTNGYVTIDLGEVKEDIKATLTNSLGQVVLTENYKSTNLINLDIVTLKGIYFLQLESDQEVITKKIIKE